VIGEYDYSHPVFDAAAIAAQAGWAASRAVAPVVLRRLDALRLPRGRPDVGLAVAEALRAAGAAPMPGGGAA
jgi:hypothetical protein